MQLKFMLRITTIFYMDLKAIIMVLIRRFLIKVFTFKILKDRENNDQKRLKNTILKHIIINLVLLF